MCKYLWWWLLHGSGCLCEMLAHLHPMCVSHELYGLCKRIAVTKRWMSNNMRSRVSYIIKPYAFDAFESRMCMVWLCEWDISNKICLLYCWMWALNNNPSHALCILVFSKRRKIAVTHDVKVVYKIVKRLTATIKQAPQTKQ